MTELSTNEENAVGLIDSAQNEIQKRGTHGEAVENHRHIAALWTAFFGVEFTSTDVANAFILAKLSREKCGEMIRDHPMDIVGYAGISWATAVADGEAGGVE